MPERVEQICTLCHMNAIFTVYDDGFFYSGCCGAQADDIIDTGIDEEQLFNRYPSILTRARQINVIVAEPISQIKPTSSQYFDQSNIPFDDDAYTAGNRVGPSDFGSQRRNLSFDDYYSEIRSRYLRGLQIMVQLQCKTLVDKFNVSPSIIGLIGPIWLRFLASTGIMADEWADQTFHESEAQTKGEAEEFQPSAKNHSEPVNIHGKSLVMIWYRSLSSKIPISCSLAISFLVCHVAREAILPSDILKWTLEGKLPYLSASGEIEKQLGPKLFQHSIWSFMLRPIQTMPTQKLESQAAVIAKKIGLQLPPVNFYAIASRYCKQLCLPNTEIILHMACQICDWSMPPGLYLSDNEFRIPTRVCIMSILTVAIRIIFDINGYGIWESSLSNPNSLPQREKIEENESDCHFTTTEPRGSTDLDNMDCRLNVVEILRILEAKYNELDDLYDYSCDLPSYIQYCKDVVFSGLQPSYEDPEEEKLLAEFWEFYQNNKASTTSDYQRVDPTGESGDLNNKKTRKGTNSTDDHNICNASQNSGTSQFGDHYSKRPYVESCKESAIRRMKLEMEENKFRYISPRTRVKRKDYLHYARRRKDVYVYAVHADYYILLRSCAKVAQVETRLMHFAGLSLERRLDWLEKKIDDSLCHEQNLNDVCEFCG